MFMLAQQVAEAEKGLASPISADQIDAVQALVALAASCVDVAVVNSVFLKLADAFRSSDRDNFVRWVIVSQLRLHLQHRFRLLLNLAEFLKRVLIVAESSDPDARCLVLRLLALFPERLAVQTEVQLVCKRAVQSDVRREFVTACRCAVKLCPFSDEFSAAVFPNLLDCLHDPHRSERDLALVIEALSRCRASTLQAEEVLAVLRPLATDAFPVLKVTQGFVHLVAEFSRRGLVPVPSAASAVASVIICDLRAEVRAFAMLRLEYLLRAGVVSDPHETRTAARASFHSVLHAWPLTSWALSEPEELSAFLSIFCTCWHLRVSDHDDMASTLLGFCLQHPNFDVRSQAYETLLAAAAVAPHVAATMFRMLLLSSDAAVAVLVETLLSAQLPEATARLVFSQLLSPLEDHQLRLIFSRVRNTAVLGSSETALRRLAAMLRSVRQRHGLLQEEILQLATSCVVQHPSTASVSRFSTAFCVSRLAVECILASAADATAANSALGPLRSLLTPIHPALFMSFFVVLSQVQFPEGRKQAGVAHFLLHEFAAGCLAAVPKSSWVFSFCFALVLLGRARLMFQAGDVLASLAALYEFCFHVEVVSASSLPVSFAQLRSYARSLLEILLLAMRIPLGQSAVISGEVDTQLRFSLRRLSSALAPPDAPLTRDMLDGLLLIGLLRLPRHALHIHRPATEPFLVESPTLQTVQTLDKGQSLAIGLRIVTNDGCRQRARLGGDGRAAVRIVVYRKSMGAGPPSGVEVSHSLQMYGGSTGTDTAVFDKTVDMIRSVGCGTPLQEDRSDDATGHAVQESVLLLMDQRGWTMIHIVVSCESEDGWVRLLHQRSCLCHVR